MPLQLLSSLRARLILLVLLTVIPALVLTFYRTWQEEKMVADQIKQEQLRLVRFISRNQSQLIDNTHHLLHVLSQLPQVRSCDSTSCGQIFANLMRQFPWYLNIGAASPDGSVFASSLPLEKPINIADRAYFQLAMSTCSLTIGEYQIGRLTGKVSLNFGYPIIGEKGEVKGVIYAALCLDWLNKLLAGVNLSANSSIFLIDHHGTILAHYPDPEKWLGKVFKELPVLQTILSQREGTAEGIDIEGVMQLYTFTSFSDPRKIGNIYLAMATPKKEVFARVDEIAHRNLIFMIIISVIAVLAALFFGNLLVLQRLKPLGSIIQRIKNGQMGGQPQMGSKKDEINQLTSAFDEMAVCLETREHERRQAEATLRESERKYRELANLLPGIVFEADEKGIITFASKRAFEIMGYSPPDIAKGLNIFQFVPPQELAKAKDIFIEALKEDKNNLFFNLKKKDTSTFPAFIHTSPIFKEGKPAGIRGIAFDITELKSIEESLRRSEDTARRLAQETEIIAEIGRIISATPNIEEIYEKFAKKLKQLINFDRIAISIINSLEKVFSIPYVWGTEVSEREMGKVLPLAGTGAEWVMQNRKSLLISEENIEEIINRCPGLWPAFQKGFRSMILCPLFSKDKIIGTLNIQTCTSNAYGEKELRILARVSAQIAGAIANALLFEERRRAEEALSQGEKRYRELVNTLPEVVFEADEKGNLIFVNERAFEIFGYTKNDFTKGINAFDMMAAEDRERAREFFQKDMYGEKSGREYKLLKKDGSIFPGIIYTHPIIRNGIPSGLRGIIIDITERKKLEEHLQESRERYKTLFENTGTAFVVIEEDMSISLANSKAEELTGYSRNEIEGHKKWTEFIVPEHLEKLKEYHRLRRIDPDLAPQSYEARFITKSGEVKDILINVAMILGTKRSIASLLDITELKQKEKEIVSLQEQFMQAQKMEAVGRLAGGIAHDFNNSLTLIKVSAQLAQMELKDGDPLRDKINTIVEATDRSANLARQLLAFSRKQVMEMKVIDLNALIKDLDKMLHRVIGEDIELIYELAEDLQKVKVDPGQMEQVILNLTLNSRDAMPRGGKLIIKTANAELDENYARTHLGAKVGKYVMLSVTDTGIGMTREIKEHLFEPFFTTKEKGKGTGLGLSTVYGIVKQSNGYIWVYSEPGQGTTFKIYLPAQDEPAEELKKREEEGAILKGSETILVVEDDEEVRRLARMVLERQGYKILSASCAEEAFDICKEYKEPIHLLLTDVIMPGMSGRDLAEGISILCPKIKIIYMSGYPDNIISDHGILKPGINYLPKPFTVEGLAKKVREVLNEGK